MRIVAVFAILFGCLVTAFAQPPATEAGAAFAVATIKPSDPYSTGKGTRIRERRFATVNTTLAYLIQYAYGCHPRQIVGGPKWLDEKKFDIVAIPEGQATPTNDEWKAMVRGLLADRFALRFHYGTRTLPVYLLVQKPVARVTRTAGSGTIPDLTFRRGEGVIRLPAKNATMDEFAHVMQRNVLDRPVIDRTGLVGRFDFTLVFTPSEYQIAMTGGGMRPATENSPPELFTALEQQLGLKLQPDKAAMQVIEIDHVAEPSMN